jgi:hypothetical protein
VGNYTEAYGNDTALPFGWADQNCTQNHIYICRRAEAGTSPWYRTNATNITFYLNTSYVSVLRSARCSCGGQSFVWHHSFEASTTS